MENEKPKVIQEFEQRPKEGNTSDRAWGFRDVHWCPMLNEPVVIEYRGDEPFCGFCMKEILDEQGKLLGIKNDGFPWTGHTFIVHIYPPKR